MSWFKYDLHIHSLLSSCSDELMTPNNIFNMAYLCELDFIAVTDHNSCLQLPSMAALSESFDVQFVFGCEVTVKEGFHICVYFKALEDVVNFQSYLERHIIKKTYNTAYYGMQNVMDEFDQETQTIDYFLTDPLTACHNQVAKKVHDLGGLVVLAHLDKKKTSALNIYPSLEGLIYDAIELTPNCNKDNFIEKHNLKNKVIISNSDSHNITTIGESDHQIELEDFSVEALFSYLRGGKNE